VITDKIIERVKRFEGFEDKPYKDTVGKTTIGYGRNLEANPLTLSELMVLLNRVEWKSKGDAEDWAEMLLKRDLERHTREIRDNFPLEEQPDNVRAVLIDMGYNVGIPTLMSFEGMLHAIHNRDYKQAAVELLDSKYAEQVKTRAVDNAKMLSHADFSEVTRRLETKNPRRYKIIEGYL
jgi:lysozyme